MVINGDNMSRLAAFIGDADILYAESLSRFMRYCRRPRIDVSTFSNRDMLITALKGSTRKPDIILVSPEFLTQELQEINKPVLVLSPVMAESVQGYHCVYKYKTGEKILDCILAFISGISPSSLRHFKDESYSKVISVISPTGGSSKSIISYLLSVRLATCGLKVFYLNLESLSSAGFFLNPADDGPGLSDIFYYIKGNSKDLSSKVNNLICHDSQYGISYFRPLLNPMESDEISEEDIDRLILELKDSGRFDAIIIDTDPVINKKIMSIMDNSDAIILVASGDAIDGFKLQSFESIVKKLDKDICHVFQNIIPVVLKSPGGKNNFHAVFDNSPVELEISLTESTSLYPGSTQVINSDCNLNRQMDNVCKLIMERANLKVYGNVP